MNRQSPETDFARRLRCELRAIVAERGAGQAALEARSATTAAHPRRRSRLALGGTVAAAGIAALLIVSAGGSDTPAAFAVEPRSDDMVDVEIRALEDASGLERALDEAGIPASVDFLGAGMACKEPRFRSVPWPDGSRAIVSGPASGDGPLSFSISREAVGPGQTLVITASPGPEVPLEDAQVRVAEGTVAPCEPVAASADSQG